MTVHDVRDRINNLTRKAKAHAKFAEKGGRGRPSHLKSKKHALAARDALRDYLHHAAQMRRENVAKRGSDDRQAMLDMVQRGIESESSKS